MKILHKDLVYKISAGGGAEKSAEAFREQKSVMNILLQLSIFGQSSSSSLYKWLFLSFVCPLSLLASREVSRVAIGFKAV